LESIYRRVVELSRQLGETLPLWRALWGLCTVFCSREEHHLARQYAEEVLLLSQEWSDPEPRLEAHRMLGVTLHSFGDFSASTAHLKQVLALSDLQQQRNLLSPNRGAAPRIMALAFIAVNAWLSGYPDQALSYSQESLRGAEEMAYPLDLAMALHLSAWLHELRRDAQRVHTQAAAALSVATEYHITFWLSHAIIDEGWAWIDQGHVEAGIARIQQGIAELCATGQPQSTAYFSSLLAKGYAAAGQSQRALEVAGEALAFVERSEQRWCEAELHRLHGEILRMQGSHEEEVEYCFWQAIELARRQQDKSWELRATLSLCRLWQEQGKQREASALLAEIYGWFTEGFDTPDLLEAKTLLTVLSAGGTAL
jgi:predicted ATPase